MNLKKISIFLLGFTSGLPYMLVFVTLGTWLAVIDIDLATIGFFAWIVLTYSLKFLWSPLVDNFSIPFLNIFGKRKSWIILTQVLIIIFLFLISITDPLTNLSLFAKLAFFVAFFGSIQDIAIDAFRIEMSEIKEQGNLAASYQLGYRIAILLATSGALILASKTDWSFVYQLMSLFMLVGFVGLYLTPENKNTSLRQLSLSDSLFVPLKDFFNRFGLYAALLLLSIISTYRLTDIMTGQIINPFYIQMGYTLEEIGFVVKTIALGASILGFFVGGKLIKSTGVNNSLIIGALLVMITNLFFAYIAISEKSLASLSLVVALDSMAAGIVGTVNITFLTSLVSKQYTAVQYALFTSFMMLPGKILAGFSGLIIIKLGLLFGDDYGWMSFFIITSALTIPSIFLIKFYKKLYE
jgi:PAT family beta-lactamase induction signal transducer AmpG